MKIYFKLSWEQNLETNVRCFNPLLWASLYTIHGWGLLFNMASLTLRLCHPSSLLSILMLFVDTECSGPVAKQCSPTPVGLSKFRCSLNRTPRSRLDPPHVCVGLVVTTQDMVDGSTLVLQGSLVIGGHNLGAQCVSTW